MSDHEIFRCYSGVAAIQDGMIGYFHSARREESSQIRKSIEAGKQLAEIKNGPNDFVVPLHELTRLIEHKNNRCDVVADQTKVRINLKNAARQRKFIAACKAGRDDRWSVETVSGRKPASNAVISVFVGGVIVAALSLMFFFAASTDSSTVNTSGRRAWLRHIVNFVLENFGPSGFLFIAIAALLVAGVSFALMFAPTSVNAHVVSSTQS